MTSRLDPIIGDVHQPARDEPVSWAGQCSTVSLAQTKGHNKAATKQGKVDLIKTALMSDKIRLTC